jgi:hypothetical protein
MHFTDHLRQAVRLGEKGRTRWKAVAVASARTSRGKDDRKLRLRFERSMSEIAAVPPTQIDVRKQDIDRLLTKDDLGLFGTGRRQNDEPAAPTMRSSSTTRTRVGLASGGAHSG